MAFQEEDAHFERMASEKQPVYLDEKDFFSQWLFDPAIKDEADYTHLDKNLATTKLSSRFKEPERARLILRALHVLNNPKYYKKKKEYVLIGYNDVEINVFTCPVCNKVHHENVDVEKVVCDCGEEVVAYRRGVVKVPIFELKNVLKNKYAKTFHNLKSAFYSLTTTAAARDGNLLRAATTTHFSREESIEDKTQVKQKFSIFPKKNTNQRY